MNGYLSGTLENYYPEVELLSTYLDESNELTLNLYPIKTFQGSVKKRLVEKSLDNDGAEIWTFKETSDQFLNIDDFVVLIIEKVLETENEEPFLQYATINGSQSYFDIDLTVGKFSIDGILMRHLGENYTLQELVIEDEEICVDPGLFEEEECVKVNGTTFNGTMYLGGVVFDESTGYFEVTSDNMLNNSVKFYIHRANINQIEKMNDLASISTDPQYTIDHYSSLVPRFE